VRCSRTVKAARTARMHPLAESLNEAGATTRTLAATSAGGGDATLLIDAGCHELVVGLQGLRDVAVCEIHDFDPFEN
jgi:hypothetical protein